MLEEGEGRVEQIEQLRQTIINLAVLGRLVPQDPSEEPASTLLKRISEARDRTVESTGRGGKRSQRSEEKAEFDLPDGWALSRLGLAFDVRDGTHDTPKYVDSGYPLITSKNLAAGNLSFEDAKLISEEDHRSISIRSKVERCDVLMAMIGSIGNPVIVDTDRPFSIKNVALFKYFDLELACPGFLRIFLRHAANKMKLLALGGLQPFVSLGFLRTYPIALPPLGEQHRIVTKVNELMTLCDQLEVRLVRGDDTRDRLLDSLLHEALAESSSDASCVPSPVPIGSVAAPVAIGPAALVPT